MLAIKHILVPTDFSEPSNRALTMAVELARPFDARLTLLHVWAIPSAGYAEALSWPVDAMEAAAQRAMDDALVLGSVAEKVVRLCPVPVLTVAAPKPSEKK